MREIKMGRHSTKTIFSKIGSQRAAPTLSINKEIFSRPCLDEAITAYLDYAKITIQDTPKAWVASFVKCRYDPVITVREFMNYMINLENQ